MKLAKSVLLTLTILSLTLPTIAQRRLSKSGKSHKTEQMDFDLDEPFKRPVKIPEAVLRLLRREIEREHLCRQEGLDQGSDIASWFSASAVNLNNDHLPDLVVKSGKGCLNGADNRWFWIFLNTGRGYQLVLTEGTLNVGLLKTRTHGLRDIETDVATASIAFSNIYKFDGLVYKARICTQASPVTAEPKRVPCSGNE